MVKLYKWIKKIIVKEISEAVTCLNIQLVVRVDCSILWDGRIKMYYVLIQLATALYHQPFYRL